MGIRHGAHDVPQDRYYTAMRYQQEIELLKQTDKYFDDRHFSFYDKQLLEKQAQDENIKKQIHRQQTGLDTI